MLRFTLNCPNAKSKKIGVHVFFVSEGWHGMGGITVFDTNK